jgi:hypothetical protein
MWDFAADQRVRDIDTLEARMWGIHEAAQALLRGRSTRPQLSRIRGIASQSKDERYKQIMSSILAAVEDGEDGIRAASLTAVRIVELIGR